MEKKWKKGKAKAEEKKKSSGKEGREIISICRDRSTNNSAGIICVTLHHDPALSLTLYMRLWRDFVDAQAVTASSLSSPTRINLEACVCVCLCRRDLPLRAGSFSIINIVTIREWFVLIVQPIVVQQ